MRWLPGLVGRLIVVGLGVWLLWLGAQFSGVGASLIDPHRDPRIPPPLSATPLGSNKLDASTNIIEVVIQSFGVLFLLLGGAAVLGGLFPWRQVLARKRNGPRNREDPEGRRDD